MTEEEAQAYADLKDQLTQKEQRIQKLEGLLMGALLRIEELEKRLAKDSHNSSLPPSRDHGTRKLDLTRFWGMREEKCGTRRTR